MIQVKSDDLWSFFKDNSSRMFNEGAKIRIAENEALNVEVLLDERWGNPVIEVYKDNEQIVSTMCLTETELACEAQTVYETFIMGKEECTNENDDDTRECEDEYLEDIAKCATEDFIGMILDMPYTKVQEIVDEDDLADISMKLLDVLMDNEGIMDKISEIYELEGWVTYEK